MPQGIPTPPHTPRCCHPVHLLPLNAPQLLLRFRKFRKEICRKPPRTFLLRQQVKSQLQGHCFPIGEVLSDSASCHSRRRAGCSWSSCTTYPTVSRTLFLLEQGWRLANTRGLVPHTASCAYNVLQSVCLLNTKCEQHLGFFSCGEVGSPLSRCLSGPVACWRRGRCKTPPHFLWSDFCSLHLSCN